MILLSDGDNTAGNIDPVTAAKLAAAYDIKIYTIGMGSQGAMPIRDDYGRLMKAYAAFDEQSLRQIAEQTGGNMPTPSPHPS